MFKPPSPVIFRKEHVNNHNKHIWIHSVTTNYKERTFRLKDQKYQYRLNDHIVRMDHYSEREEVESDSSHRKLVTSPPPSPNAVPEEEDANCYSFNERVGLSQVI